MAADKNMFDENDVVNRSTTQESVELDHGLFDDDDSGMVKTKRNLVIAGSLLLVLILALAAYLFDWLPSAGPTTAANQGPPPAPVVVAQAQTITMSPHTTLPGTVVSLRDAVVASETSGKVLSVALVGDIIAAGESLAEIDPQNAQQLVAQRQAELDRLASLYNYHSNYLTRVGAEDNELGIPEITIAELRSNVETAKADVARARSALISAQNDLARTSIKAPFDGRVVSQSIQPGEFAQIGAPVARLVDIKNLEISARVPAALVQPIEPGTKLKVVGMGREISAALRALVPVGDSISRTMELRVSLENTELLVGSPVRVTLPTAVPKEVVAIPRDAVILRPNQQYVFVVKDGTAHRRDVELGYGQGALIEVIGDVPTDATVVVRGGERLRDGEAVTWQQNDNPAKGT